MFSLSTLTIFSCNLSYSQTNTWTLSRIDLPQVISLTDNPTSTTPELVMPANSLEYGLYQFTFQVDIQTSSNALSNSIYTFIQIIPTGLAVFALQNGISSLLIGSKQAFVLNPAAYSVDLDNLVSPSSLQYKIFCNTINLNSSTQSNQVSTDLLTFKSNASLVMASNVTCFSSNSMLKLH